MFTGLDRVEQWLGLPGHQTLHHIKALICTLSVDYEENIIACTTEAVAAIRQHPGILEHTCQSLLCHCWLCIELSGHTFEHLL
jgi:hypothetical protein